MRKGHKYYVQTKNRKEIRCPVEYGLSIISGKWKIRILSILKTYGTVRYKVLMQKLNGITDTVLALTLKELANDDLIIRNQYEEIPPKVEYMLSDKAISLMPILESICRWSCRFDTSYSDHVMEQCRGCEHFNY